jgi:hypothetical protein
LAAAASYSAQSFNGIASEAAGASSAARRERQASRQSAYRNRPSVTVTGESNSPIEEVFRYARHADVPRFMTEGWELLLRSMARITVNTRRWRRRG